MLMCWLPLTLLAEPLRVTVSTSLIEGIAMQVGGDRVTLVPVIPFAMCPGQFDVSPRTAAAIEASDLFLLHGFESFARGLRFPGGGPTRVRLEVSGHGLVPSVHRDLTRAVKKALVSASPEDAELFRTRAEAYLEEVDAVVSGMEDERLALRDVPVLASSLNAPFVEWLGLTVEATFPRDEALSARALGELVRQGRSAHVRLVVDNRQSLGRTGQHLARELGVPLVVWSNFPSVESGGYPMALREALESVLAAVAPLRAEEPE